MRVTFWGTRGSIATPGPETFRYGGNTSCVEVRGADGTIVVLDAGTGIRRLNGAIDRSTKRIDILLTHLHMDHIIGLGFFAPLRWPGLEVHIWGPASTTQTLSRRLSRYLSPPLFPVHLRDLPVDLHLHEVPCGSVQIGELVIESKFVIHPGPTVGYRITGPGGSMAYLSDHEPALGSRDFPDSPMWTSGYSLARDVDLLIHDAQYTDREYATRIGWGHSTLDHALAFATMVGARRLIPFHHDPGRHDEALEKAWADAIERRQPSFAVEPAHEGRQITIE